MKKKFETWFGGEVTFCGDWVLPVDHIHNAMLHPYYGHHKLNLFAFDDI
jgi:hypothetical protein